MRKLILALTISLIFVSCSNQNDEVIPDFQQSFIPIDRTIVPETFTLNQATTVSVFFTLPSNCHVSPRIFIGPEGGNSRLVSVTTNELINTNCTQETRDLQLDIPLFITETRDYTFRFWTGQDANGEDIFDEVIVPVVQR